MYILGVQNLYDASACLLKDGKEIVAAEEERFTRKKHHYGFPYNAIKFCLDEFGITLRDVDHVGFFWKPWILRRRIISVLQTLPRSLELFKSKSKRGMGEMHKEYINLFTVQSTLKKAFGPGNFKFHYIEHHFTHAASAFLVSPFDKAAILTIDGTGEETTAMLSVGVGNQIEALKKIKLPNSLGHLYSAVTGFLGFKVRNGEGKVMGLAPYGEPSYYETFKKIIYPDSDGGFVFDSTYIDYHLARENRFLEKSVDIFGKPRTPEGNIEKRHQDIAASLQKRSEDIGIHLANKLYKLTKAKNLCLAGGSCLNSVMNYKIFKQTPFENIYIQPAASDIGCSLGSVFYVYNTILGKTREIVMDSASTGPKYSNNECKRELEKYPFNYKYVKDPSQVAAELLSSKKIIGWFQGRMEFGPRALGNRSILADPRDSKTKDVLNEKVKHREGFRPFAPSLLEEYCGEYFCCNHPSPFMLLVYDVRPEKRNIIPAVTHVDGTGRVQTVNESQNPLYYHLIKEFYKITGVPVVLNTSFNVRGEPIVCSPHDAIECFKNTQMDYLMLGNWLVEK